jgi:hypothetical protein
MLANPSERAGSGQSGWELSQSGLSRLRSRAGERAEERAERAGEPSGAMAGERVRAGRL